MPIDASIPLGIKQPEIQDPTNALLKVLQVQGLQDARQKEQWTMDRQNRLDQLLRAGNVDASGLRNAGFLDESMKFEKNSADTAHLKAQTDQAAAAAGKDHAETAHKQLDAIGQAAGWLQQNPSLENAGLVLQHLQAAGAITPQSLQEYQARFQADPSPEGIARVASMAYRAALATKDQLPKLQTNNIGGSTVTQAVDPVTGQAKTVSTLQNTVSPDAQLSSDTSVKTTGMNNATSVKTTGMNNATSTANTNANIGKDYRVAGLNPDGTDPNGTVGGLTPQAIDNAAKRYNFDGTLPPSIGRGTQGSRDLRAIQNRAAELNGAAPDDASGGRAGQVANKADAGAFAKLTSQQQMASSFERTANANADIALGLSKKMDRTGIPLINAGIQAWRTGTGSPEATQFAAANETFVNEYAKIMSGGMGNGPVTDSARSKAHGLLSTAMTPEQYEGNVRLLQREMQNRMKGYSDQAAEIKTRMQGGTQPASTAAPKPGGMPDASAIDAELRRRGVH